MQYNRGLLIGRFQPLHFGHIHLFHEVLKSVDRIIVGVGSAQKYQIHTDENPFSYEMRERMLNSMIDAEGIRSRIDSIIPLVDDPDDDTWRAQVLQKTGAIDVVISNNDWVNGIFERAGIKTLSIPFYKREVFEGKKIREMLKDSDKYHDYLPEYVWRIVNSE